MPFTQSPPILCVYNPYSTGNQGRKLPLNDLSVKLPPTWFIKIPVGRVSYIQFDIVTGIPAKPATHKAWLYWSISWGEHLIHYNQLEATKFISHPWRHIKSNNWFAVASKQLKWKTLYFIISCLSPCISISGHTAFTSNCTNRLRLLSKQ